jgi:FkbM family methyltransferase
MSQEFDFPCIHRSEPTGRLFDCGCGMRDEPVFRCLHPVIGDKECVVRMGKIPRPVEPVSCTACNFREPPAQLSLDRQPPRDLPSRPGPAAASAVAMLLNLPVLRPDRPFDAIRAQRLAEREGRVYAPQTDNHSLATNVIARFDEQDLSPGLPGKRFNASIIEDPTTPGGYLLAFRDGWAGSEIHLIRLDASFAPVGPSWKLGLRHKIESHYGREDPRLFMHQGRVHVSYTGVAGQQRIVHTSVLYARLTADCQQVEQQWYPYYEDRNSWEKNWAFFSHGDELYAVYSIAPHRILRIDGSRATLAYESAFPFRWSGGVLRGGASPLRVGNEWWHVFHDRVKQGMNVYRGGLYAFSAEPPFAPLRLVPEPIMQAEPETLPVGQPTAVVFPGGVVRQDDRLIVALGVHDRWTELREFSVDSLRGRLGLLRREGSNDHLIYESVVQHDEYRLNGLTFAPDDIVLDIGAHAGSFAFKAYQRGSRNILCYEANAGNFAALKANTAGMPGLALYHNAVWHTAGVTVYSHPPQNKADLENLGGCWVNEEAQDEAVTTVAFDDLLRYAGRVAFLKVDCERAEFQFIPQSSELHRVDRLAMEFHATPELPLSLLTDKLDAAGFNFDIWYAPDDHQMGLIFGSRVTDPPA